MFSLTNDHRKCKLKYQTIFFIILQKFSLKKLMILKAGKGVEGELIQVADIN